MGLAFELRVNVPWLVCGLLLVSVGAAGLIIMAEEEEEEEKVE
jgi:hypothetical protein